MEKIGVYKNENDEAASKVHMYRNPDGNCFDSANLRYFSC